MGWSVPQTAAAIHECCSVRRLRAYRLARGLTLKQAGEELRHLGESRDANRLRADADQLSLWETGGRAPRAAMVALLCDYYKATSYELGLGDDGPAQAETATVPLSISSLPDTYPAVDPLADHVDSVRRSVDRTLAAGSVSPGQLDLLDERLLLCRQEYVSKPPAPMLKQLLVDVQEVNELAKDRQPASVQVRLAEMTAVLATLIADALMKLGDLPRSRSWYSTARHASDESGDLDLRARVRAQAAMLPYYYGPLESAITLAREARIMTRSKPSPTAAFAAVAEARALAQQGNKAVAETRIREARAIFDQLPATSGEDAFAFPVRRFLLYLSGAFTALGQSSQARRVQEDALALYPAGTGIDPALLHLEAALCLVHDHSATEACQLAAATYLRVPEAHRTPILGARARRVIEGLPGTNQATPAAKDLCELLELPSASR
ncbi:helix-turn-helix domain-containing protein [Streptomyces tubercidicus]|uniref:helix-turn-helix domain-containing protein n=1 Tax=Streptomyces tubercidicus TaxID=47759 RepID=UPI0037BA0117